MFPTRNGTGVLFLPAYIDHGSTKPFVIGNAARPRAFKQNSVTPDNLPVTWKHYKKAWMTTTVFGD
jgi:hypothetical protein